MELPARLQPVWTALGGAGDASTLAAQILAAYDEPDRAYHTRTHLVACLDLLDTVRVAAQAAAEVELALWFHDAVYDPRRHDSEQRSAAWTRTAMVSGGIAEATTLSVSRLVLATAHMAVQPDASGDAALVVDIDLAILGAPPEQFDAYETAIRREYMFLPDKAWRAGRSLVLTAFANRTRIFHTQELHAGLEQAARRNIARSLASLPLP